MDFDLGGPMLPEGVTAVDCGDLPIDLEDSAANRRRITAAVATRRRSVRIGYAMGGDAWSEPASVAFVARSDGAIMQIDATARPRQRAAAHVALGLNSTRWRRSSPCWTTP